MSSENTAHASIAVSSSSATSQASPVQANITVKKFREDVFDREIRALFEHLQNVISTNDLTKVKMDSRSINPFMKYLKKYITVYNKMKPEEHKEYFLSIFKKHQGAILKGYSNDSWLKENSVQIQFGEGTKAVNKEIRIMLSGIYLTATRLKQATEERLEGLPDSARETAHELNYPELIMLHLYRLFRESVEYDNDKNDLSKLVREIEEELNIAADAPMESAPGFSALGDIIGGLASNFGVQIDKSKLPDMGSLMTGVNNLINNPKSKEVLSTVATGLQNSKNINDAIRVLTKEVDPNLIKEIGESLNFPGLMNGPNQPESGAPTKESEADGPKGTEVKQLENEPKNT